MIMKSLVSRLSVEKRSNKKRKEVIKIKLKKLKMLKMVHLKKMMKETMKVVGLVVLKLKSKPLRSIYNNKL